MRIHTGFFIASLVLVLVTVLPRLYRIDAPVADWHSWRQSDTAAVARNFIKFGFDPLRPRYDDVSNIQSGMDNPQGWRMVEFPLYQLVSASVAVKLPVLSLEVWMRLINILLQAGTAVLLFAIVSVYLGWPTGILAAFLFAVLPYNIYYGRTILPDVSCVFWAVLSIYALDRFFRMKRMENGNLPWFIVSAAAGALSILTKPVGVFLLLPDVYLFVKNFHARKKWWILIIAYGMIVIFPFWWWRTWISQFPEGIPAYTWLFNDGNIRFKGAWFYWLFAERLSKLILGYWGVFPFAAGLIAVPQKKEGWFFRFWALGVVLYFTVIARGNVQHDYYQILWIPAVSIFTAKGFIWMLSVTSKINAVLSGMAVFLFMTAFSWYTVRTYYWINRPEIIEAGQAADKLIAKNAKVIAPYNGDTTFLYQINRQGWPIGFDIDRKMKLGAGYYVTVSPTDADLETKSLAEKYRVLVRNDKFAIIDLTEVNPR